MGWNRDNFIWSADGSTIYFVADWRNQTIFKVNFPGLTKIAITISKSYWRIWRQWLSRFFGWQHHSYKNRYESCFRNFFISFEEKPGNNFQMSILQPIVLWRWAKPKGYVTTTDGKKMLVWVVLPPNTFKKISNTFILSRWTAIAIDAILLLPMEFTVMANGYIVVAQTVAECKAWCSVEWANK
jgi:hypothetical protein